MKIMTLGIDLAKEVLHVHRKRAGWGKGMLW